MTLIAQSRQGDRANATDGCGPRWKHNDETRLLHGGNGGGQPRREAAPSERQLGRRVGACCVLKGSPSGRRYPRLDAGDRLGGMGADLAGRGDRRYPT